MTFDTETVSVLHTPEEFQGNTASQGDNIYGFKPDKGMLYYAVQSSTNLQTSQKEFIKSVEVPGVALKVSVSIEGIFRYGEVLTAKTAVSNEGANDADFIYQWYRNDIKIPGAVSGNYTSGKKDIGKQIRVKVQYEEFAGELEFAPVEIQKTVPGESPVGTLQGAYG